MQFIGLDLSLTRTGFAIISERGVVETFGHWKFPKNKYNTDGMRYLAFQTKMSGLLSCVGDNTIVGYELVNQKTHKGGAAAWAYGALRCMTLLLTAENGLRVDGVHVNTVKKTAGDGRASKEFMVQAAYDKWGLTVNHDEADALWVAETVRLKHVTLSP